MCFFHAKNNTISLIRSCLKWWALRMQFLVLFCIFFWHPYCTVLLWRQQFALISDGGCNSLLQLSANDNARTIGSHRVELKGVPMCAMRAAWNHKWAALMAGGSSAAAETCEQECLRACLLAPSPKAALIYHKNERTWWIKISWVPMWGKVVFLSAHTAWELLELALRISY
jgi:hypothetical protein